MNEETKNKIKIISEILSMYQNTVIKETDRETISLIQRDVAGKKMELETIKENLELELDKLYENGANEIDPEVNQLQIIINEVEDLMDDVIPDILIYTKKVQTQEKKIESIKPEIKVEPVKPVKKVEAIKPEIKVEPVKPVKKVEVIKPEIKVEPVKAEKKIEVIKPEIKVEPVKAEKKIEVIKPEVKVEPVKPVKKVEVIKPEIKVEPVKPVKKVEIISPEEKVEPIKKESVSKVEIKRERINTIMLKQPSQDYKNSATSIVLNRFKNVDSPENAILKTHNAAEVVMNNIMQKWNENL